MSTPQSCLYNLEYKLNRLSNSLSDDEGDILEHIKALALSMAHLQISLAKVEDQQALIIKLLSK